MTTMLNPAVRRAGGLAFEGAPTAPTEMCWVALLGAGAVNLPGGECSLWLQLRGSSVLTLREGRFRLGRGDWMMLDRAGALEVQAQGPGRLLGVVPGVSGHDIVRDLGLLSGRGTMTRTQLGLAIRLWRAGAATSASSGLMGIGEQDQRQALQALFAQVAALQQDFAGRIARCPGRSLPSKRRVFARMQRARLFLEGNRHRIVRLTELAELTSFSIWYLSRMFHEIYGESPQEACVRFRLERALELLSETDWSIKRIAVECGFDNSGSFGRAFRHAHGQTPTAYRDAQMRVRQVMHVVNASGVMRSNAA